MSFDYVRKIVSGGKARYVDPAAAVDLDLVYVTDRIIIMGYPASGVAGLYRNRRRDVLKFLDSRHGEKWWIWNLCPLYENAYSPQSMHGRVSRYPFPDHHPPPLPLLPLAVREMTAWLQGDHDRIAIIHCKAGKGRSGTLLCSYLLSLPELPPAPQLDRSYTPKELALRAAQREQQKTISPVPSEESDREGWVYIGGGDEVTGVQVTDPHTEDGASTPAHSERINVDPVTRSTNSSTTTLSRPSLPPSVNISVSTSPPYDPIDIGDEKAPGEAGQEDRADGRVDEVFRLHSSRRMKPTSTGRGVSIPSLIGGAGGTGQGKAWAAVARYDDDYVNDLKARGGTGQGVGGQIAWGGVGGEGSHDKRKMFRSCGKMVAATLDQDIEAVLPDNHQDYVVHHLKPNSRSLILDRSREFRLKFHLASVPLGWTWLIPAFHLPEPRTTTAEQTSRIHTLHFPRSQIDFPLGPGQAIHQVLVRLEEVPDDEKEGTARLMDEDEEREEGLDETRGEKVKEDGE
ncbi:hypothetical protein IAR55_005463 [Kwoniella newhampshirensis]|uniref:phosphatidylinositol-3,4,5-trisphosphate 3-phosphatase n=1 Tax=Kwoniella newhampshirensis TaxID=1651941 RepID=A0AAW0YWE3_9TREE